MSAEGSREGYDWLRIAATVVLALATIATAWGGYQAARWNSATGSAYSNENTLSQAANRADSRADTLLSIDVAIFMQWIDATAKDDEKLARFYRDRFRDEFEPAFEAWRATRPLQDDDGTTPFDQPEYRLADQIEAQRLLAASVEAGTRARSNSQIADNYVFVTVLFATTLFFAGIASSVASRRRSAAMLALGVLAFTGTVIWVSTFPIDIGI